MFASIYVNFFYSFSVQKLIHYLERTDNKYERNSSEHKLVLLHTHTQINAKTRTQSQNHRTE